ncbi:MAG: hypothetical protein ACI33J_01715 [Clostridium sp.]
MKKIANCYVTGEYIGTSRCFPSLELYGTLLNISDGRRSVMYENLWITLAKGVYHLRVRLN